MQLVGARFSDARDANAALAEIRSTVRVPPADVAARPLGSTRYEERTDDLVVAGRFDADAAERVVEILERHGGTVIARRAEWREPPWVPPTRPSFAPATRRIERRPGTSRDARAGSRSVLSSRSAR